MNGDGKWIFPWWRSWHCQGECSMTYCVLILKMINVLKSTNAVPVVWWARKDEQERVIKKGRSWHCQGECSMTYCVLILKMINVLKSTNAVPVVWWARKDEQERGKRKRASKKGQVTFQIPTFQTVTFQLWIEFMCVCVNSNTGVFWMKIQNSSQNMAAIMLLYGEGFDCISSEVRPCLKLVFDKSWM